MPYTRAKTILVTGFGAFPGAPTNPTSAIVNRLAKSRRLARLGLRIEAHVFPVVYARIEAEIAGLLARTRPDFVIHLGLAARRKVISIETRAINRIGRLRPDAERRFSAASAVVAGGPSTRRARWPAARLVVAAGARGARVRLSIDAGDYLCNQLLYLTLGMTPAPAGFIHVPKPGGRAVGARRRRLSLTQIGDAVEAAILAAAARPCGATP